MNGRKEKGNSEGESPNEILDLIDVEVIWSFIPTDLIWMGCATGMCVRLGRAGRRRVVALGGAMSLLLPSGLARCKGASFFWAYLDAHSPCTRVTPV